MANLLERQHDFSIAPRGDEGVEDAGLSRVEHGYPIVSDEMAANLVELFKLLADATRLKVLFMLLEMGESHVRGLCERLGQSQPAVSHHLALLRGAGLIDRRREGKHNFYYLVPREPQQLLDIMLGGLPENEPFRRWREKLARYTPAVEAPNVLPADVSTPA